MQLSLKAAIDTNDCRLPPEQETGNVEYKLLLHNHQPDRLEHYLSQLKWRLAEHHHCTYMIGVEDDGRVVGTRRAVFDDTMAVLKEMVRRVPRGEVQWSEYEVAPGKWCAECVITDHNYNNNDDDGHDGKVLVVGGRGVGKSTLIGVLASGQLDDGRGSARITQLHHRHELLSGHTQSRSIQYVHVPVNGGKLLARPSVDDLDAFSSAVTDTSTCDNAGRVVQMIDTPGFPSHTSLACLTTVVPPNLVLMVTSSPIVSSDASDEQYYRQFERVCHFFRLPTAHIRTHSPQDGVDLTTGDGMERLLDLLQHYNTPRQSQSPTTALMIIEQVYYGEQVGLIVSGLVQNGPFTRHDRVRLSPTHHHATINSIHRMRSEVPSATPGQYVTFSLAVPDGILIERGMCLVVDAGFDGVDGDVMGSSVKISEERLVMGGDELGDGQQGTVLINGSKYGGQYNQDTITLSTTAPIHPNAPVIFITADHQILCAHTII